MVQILPTLLFGAQLLSTVVARSIPDVQPREAQKYPYPELGSDKPADWATTGYNINHFCLNVKNLTESVEFYSNVFGLRKLFTLQVSKTYSITYMGHSHGGKNGTGYQTAAELNREKNNAQGLIELIHVDVPNNSIEGTHKRPSTFAHIGLVVPDTKKVQERLDTMPHVQVLKKYGHPIDNLDAVVGPALGLSPEVVAQLDQEEKKTILGGMGPSLVPLIFVVDPDDNFIEIQSQEATFG
ncbi:hypothetical protein FSARC_14359 [Fusarium sarcochroum]|uniref:Glyoxalase/fosfomycin resistance/dioxygenase domain-containing protein n=1 Tax=Fusarium sarcochroum TaxID=1208366 RepID=A0A8H4SUI8_9HYPO|nr:hypothetical protein FSARC_14359 [Fusarium sarcochroum]